VGYIDEKKHSLSLNCSNSPIFISNFDSKQLTQTSNVKVLSYSYHVDTVNNLLVVYGEVQNQGSGIVLMLCYLAPFTPLLDFNAPKTSDGSWSSATISKIDFNTAQAIATTIYPYPDVKITSESYSIDTTVNASGTYWATCTLQNSGGQTAQNIFVVGAFYNSTGTAVSGGWSTRINSLAPSATASVKVVLLK